MLLGNPPVALVSEAERMSRVFVSSWQTAVFGDSGRMTECLHSPDAYIVFCSEM